MPVVGVTWETTQDEAENRVDKNGFGEVTENGDYYREQELPLSLYDTILSMAEDDDEATVSKVAL